MLNYASDTVQSILGQIDELVEQIEALSAPERQDLQITLLYLGKINSYSPHARILIRAIGKIIKPMDPQEPANNPDQQDQM